MEHRNTGKVKPQPEADLVRNREQREVRDIKQIWRWYFDEHKDRDWIAVKLPHREPDWIWDVIQHKVGGWLV